MTSHPKGQTKRKSSARYRDFSPYTRQEIIRRSASMCEMPGCSHRGEVFHHRLRRSQGGMGTVDNGLHLCNLHHLFVHANAAESFEQGWLLHAPPRL